CARPTGFLFAYW
nr:immunoglobulin heavy chain junction region [Mus musculus]